MICFKFSFKTQFVPLSSLENVAEELAVDIYNLLTKLLDVFLSQTAFVEFSNLLHPYFLAKYPSVPAKSKVFRA